MNINVNKKISILAVEHPYERHAVRVLSVVFALLVCAYLYFVAVSVLNVMARKEALTQVDQLQGTIGTLENQYFALSQEITPEQGSSIGLVAISKTDYVYRPGNVGKIDTGENAAI